MTKLVKKEDFDEIVTSLENGNIVAFPTDTVYGVGVIYSNQKAIDAMKVAKGRDANKPFPLMVGDVSQLPEVAFLNDRDMKIAQKFTPGALTMVLKKKDIISSEATNGFDTIAIRIPDDEFVLKLLNTVGPMFVTSANLSNHPSCNNDQEVLEQLDGRIDLVVEGNAVSEVASTIIDCTKDEIVLLRQGDITMDEINKAIA